MSLFSLVLLFAYIGLLTIGGGLVAIPIMQQEIIAKRALISAPKFISMIAISESTPGPIGINMATYIGYEMYSLPGAIATSIGTTIPSIVIIIFIAKYLDRYNEKPAVRAAFDGLRPATTGMIAVAVAQIFTVALINSNTFYTTHLLRDLLYWKNFVFYLLLLFGLFKLKMHPMFAILFGAVFGLLLL